MSGLPGSFPARAEAMARRGGLSFHVPPDIVGHDPAMRFPRPIGEGAATAIALCGDAAAEIWRRRTGEAQRASVTVRAAAAAVAGYAYQVLAPGSPEIQDADWEPYPEGLRAWGSRSMLRGENASNPAVALYPTRDGRWFHVHGGLPHLARRIMTVLKTDSPGIGAAVASWRAEDLEDALAEAGTCGVAVRDATEWLAHPQGQALTAGPLVTVDRIGDAPARGLPQGARPLAGLRVLDLSLALAGPTCARTLAEYGADVLKISAPGRADRQPFLVETGHGKRWASLDLDRPAERDRLVELVRGADVFAQSYRPGALARRGFGPRAIARLSPGAITVSISCYGNVGPWADRRGWEGLAQAATGLTVPRGDGLPPRLAPGSVCDYLTGYLAARGVMEALLRRADEGGSWHVSASLCRTGMWLAGFDLIDETGLPAELDMHEDLLVATDTPYGPLRHLPPALHLPSTPPRWESPPPRAGQDEPEW
ncbi:CoA transferase [Halovulum sp. GXIMD14794]